MSRTTRKNKWGEKVRDGKRYSCRCPYCTGETKKKNEAEVFDKEIKDTVDLFYGDHDFWWECYDQYEKNYPYPTLEEEMAWIEYLEAA